MPRKQQGWITFQSSEEERQLLEEYCQQSQRTKTEILRELLRSLHSPAPTSPPPLPEPPEMATLSISARNVIPASVKQVIWGTVNAEVVLEVAPHVELVATITKASGEKLGLRTGKTVYAVIKSSNIMIGDIATQQPSG
ncbi:TOBE domain-containing protein [Desertifilum sp. FACHB-1129]|uniref:Transporter n=2 Tax=Desertifilum tharense IPPAS B-1220 TaxID=1781255 RepID=A0A1E5QJQ0_9CYAN|nr:MULTISPECIES: molybdopterin-binding protein [Desertifilum]MDA0211392.1 molybdopterin-binding protein [Cyanobacteria bacterium FC1]MBD2313563.1 TOBE domain-containing protein [Desertifilum sp. FACHB-1129]MBD2323895.1 TOBE domain-containing protein [Desertifilum sp. FACHB-866]MBD2333740.1 TOBE domain-containing protein [Desertifilum sp. FACHB-868]OEJ74919.1 transporter [Desertifilum tharense IPPAS B-1220]